MPLAVLSWNILADVYALPERYEGVAPELLAPGARAETIAATLAAAAADVLCLQEVEDAAWDRLRAKLTTHPHARPAPKGLGRPDGCAVFSTLPIEEHRRVEYGDRSGHVGLLVRVRAGSGSVTVATTHLKWDRRRTPAAKRHGLREARELVAALAGFHPGGPWIVCGDFNVEPGDDVLAVFREAGLRDAFEGSAAPTCVTGGSARRIDFLLHSPSLAARPRPVHALRGGEALPTREVPSDHVPIVADFELRGAR